MSVTQSSITLPAEISNVIIQNAIGESAIMQLARRIDLPGHGAVIPVITGDPTAYFVDEAGVKTAADPTLTAKTMKPRTVAIIETFSNQFRNNNEALYDELVARLPKLLAQRFDQEVFHGTAVTGFDTFASVSEVSILSDAWAGLVGARAAIEAEDGELTGWALAPQGITTLLGVVDGNDRPLFTGGVTDGEYGRLIGEQVVKAKKAYRAAGTTGVDEIVGYAGDWSKALYGIVNDINITISDEATITGVGNLFEKNMFAVRCEMEIGFVCADDDQFVALTYTAGSAS